MCRDFTISQKLPIAKKKDKKNADISRKLKKKRDVACNVGGGDVGTFTPPHFVSKRAEKCAPYPPIRGKEGNTPANNASWVSAAVSRGL